MLMMSFGLGRFIVLLAAIGGLAVAAACTTDAQRIREANEAAAVGSKTSEILTGKISVFDIRGGDCFDAPPVPGTTVVDLYDVELVSCSGDWAYKSLNSFVVDLDGDMPEESYWHRVTDTQCHRLANVFIVPHAESWALGDRTVVCLMEG